MNVKNLRLSLINKLNNSGVDEYEADIALILMHTLKINKSELIMGDRIVSQQELSEIYSCIQRLCEGEPVQYIIGRCEFMSLEFITKSGVLIPRADTEVVVEAVMQRLDFGKELLVADLCCGSGCIGISLAHYMKNISVNMVDISEVALDIAKKNAQLNGVDDRLKFINADIMKQLPDVYYDCVVSNPPYIKSEIISSLDRKVRQYEPKIALDGGADGLEFYRRIAKHTKLKKGGLLALEIGYDQGEDVYEILNQCSYTDIEILSDIENRDRVVLGYFTKDPAE